MSEDPPERHRDVLPEGWERAVNDLAERGVLAGFYLALTYFDDAEREPMPHMLVALDWSSVKAFFATEVPRLI